MKAIHLFTQTLLFATFLTAPAMGQIKTVSVSAPPEIKLVPLPSRVVVFQDFDTGDPNIVREKKADLIGECIDSLLSVFAKTLTTLIPGVECIVLPADIMNDSMQTPFLLLRQYKADIALGMANFRPEIVQGEVTTTKNDDRSKSKSAAYSLMASGTLRIYNNKQLIKTFPFSESEFLQDRAVVSGLFAAGQSLVKNKKSALEVTDLAARNLAGKFVPQQSNYTVTLFQRKELKELIDMIERDKYEEALEKALLLTSHENEAVSSRAYYLCALLYHIKMDYVKAFEYAQQARKTKKILTTPEWNAYPSFLKKYAVDNEVVWQ